MKEFEMTHCTVQSQIRILQQPKSGEPTEVMGMGRVGGNPVMVISTLFLLCAIMAVRTRGPLTEN